MHIPLRAPCVMFALLSITTGVVYPIVVTGLTVAKTYTCAVRAVNAIGNGPASAVSAGFVFAVVPGAPAAAAWIRPTRRISSTT